MRFTNILFLLIIMLCSSKLSASDFYFKNYKVEDGLSQNTVFCIHQDQSGLMWFGTNDGLNRFDGYNFKIYRRSNDSTSIGNSKISCLTEDKSGHLYVGTAIGVYVYNPMNEQFTLFSKKTKDGTGIHSRINSIVIDASENIWIATREQGFFIYRPHTEELIQVKHEPDQPEGLPANEVDRIFIDSKQNVWLACKGLYRYFTSSGQFRKMIIDEKGSGEVRITKFYEDNNSNIWIGTENHGLQKFNRELDTFSSYFDKQSALFIPYIHDLIEISSNVLAIGSNSGLINFNTITGNHELIHASKEKGDLSDYAIYCFYKDTEGAFWLGTYFGGVNYLYSINKRIELYTHHKNKNSVSGVAISRFYEDKTGNIWIATEDAGLNLFEPASKKFTHYLGNYNIQAIMADNDEMWLGTYGHGIIVWNSKTDKIVKNYSVIPKSNESGSLIKSIFKDSHERIWVGTTEGLFLFNQNTESFNLVEGTKHVFVWDIIEDKNNDIWFVSSGSGVFRYTYDKNILKNYLHEKNNIHSVSDNFILTLCIDNNQQLWFGTEENGFCKYNYENDRFDCYNDLPRFSNRLIYAIVSDNYNHIWFSTSNGLYRFNPENKNLKVFTADEGLQSNQFNFNSGFRASNGKLYFGGVNGFNSFFPEDLKENEFIPPIHLTNFQIFNENVKIGEKGSPLTESMLYTKKIVLSHKQNVFNFEFVSLSYVNPGKNRYAYKMEGFDNDWNYTEEHKVTYTSLPPGKYIFRVRGSNNDGKWNENGTWVELQINPPFWKTKLALVIYFLLLMAVIYLINRRYVLHERKKQKDALEKAQAEKEKELYNSKMTFFTNIAHEIKTPLSLIKAPLEKIINGQEADEEETKADLNIIKRNTEQLHSLIMQLLDFRKIESGSVKTTFVSSDISEIIENVLINFKTAAGQKKITIGFSHLGESLFADVDRDALNKILMNVISNALKFTNDRINVCLFICEEDSNYFKIEVQDNGKGVPETEKENIFLPFQQASNGERDHNFGGVGIGLSYSRSLAELHHGFLSVENNIDSEGSTFTIQLPMRQEHVTKNTERSISSETNMDKEKQEKKPLSLLIVEDNDDMRHFLKRSLKHDYIVYTAINGKDALNLLEKNTPDMIITDLMMPEMDGIEFTRLLKNNVGRSHIPVIMLTAKTTIESKIEGYAIGADSYVEKPFSIDLLKTRIINLFENREKVKLNYARSPYVQSITIANNKTDEEFIARMKSIIMQHIHEEDFSVDELATHMFMSRSGLFAKIKGISGMSPLDYIKTERLKKAAEMLTENKYSIAEIAQTVGYSTPSYFSKAFQKQFGVLPKDFKKS